MNERYDIPKFLNALSLVVLGMVFGVIYYGTYKSHSQSYEAEKNPPETKIEYVYIEKPVTEVVTETVYIPYEEPFYRNLTEEDAYYLMDMAMREAESESVIGQAMVMLVVINRAEAFGMSIKEVCESSAFESSAFRSGITPNENCKEALALIEEGWTPKPLYFRKDRYHTFGTPLFSVDSHYFSY